MFHEILVQGIGLLGVICFIMSFQIKSNKALFLAQMTGSGLFCVQFLLMGAYSGCLSLLVIVIRNWFLARADKWPKVLWKGWALLIIIVCAAIMIITWAGPLSILPFLAMAGGTIGYYSNNAQTIRFVNLICCSPAWLIYDFIVGSIGGVLNESIVLVSILVSIYRYGWEAMGDPDFGKKERNQ